MQQRPSQGTGAGAGQRPGQGESGTRGDKLQEAQGNRDANRDENREDWQNWSNDRQEDRQKWAHNEADDREDFYEENGGAYYYGGGWGYGGGHYTVIDDDHDDWVGVVAGLAIGSALTAAAFSSMQQSTACTMSEATVNGVRYYRCGNTWYTRVMDGSNINYVVVSPPVGY